MTSERNRAAICSAVANLLREERERCGMPLLLVAKQAGLSRQMVSYVEQQRRNPTLATLLRMCDALDLDFESVIRRAKAEAAKR